MLNGSNIHANLGELYFTLSQLKNTRAGNFKSIVLPHSELCLVDVVKVCKVHEVLDAYAKYKRIKREMRENRTWQTLPVSQGRKCRSVELAYDGLKRQLNYNYYTLVREA